MAIRCGNGVSPGGIDDQNPPFSAPETEKNRNSSDLDGPLPTDVEYELSEDLGDSHCAASDSLLKTKLAQWLFGFVNLTNYFQILGVPLLRGRSFTDNEGTPGADRTVVIVSHFRWRNSGSSPELVGSTFRINGRLFTALETTPEGFSGAIARTGPEFCFPLGVLDVLNGGQSSLQDAKRLALNLMARLQLDITADFARSALAGTAAGREQHYAIEQRDQVFLVAPLPRFSVGSEPRKNGIKPTPLGTVLLGLTNTVLLIVSLNLAGLFLIRGHAQRSEFAIRHTVGTTRSRLIRQLSTEGFILALGGGALGSLSAILGTKLLIATVSSRLPFAIRSTSPAPVVLVVATLVLCIMATLFSTIGADYLAAVERPLLHGRTFARSEADQAGAAPVAIIAEARTVRLRPGEDALGRHIERAVSEAPPDADSRGDPIFGIVGIASILGSATAYPKSPGALYVRFAQGFKEKVQFILRSVNAELVRLRNPVQCEIWAAVPNVPPIKERAFREHKDGTLVPWLFRRIGLVLAAFGAVAVLIAAIGLYRAEAYCVSRRTREIGIRLALGGGPTRLRYLILREGARLSLVGIALGLPLGAAIVRLLSIAIIGFDGFDRMIFCVAPLGLLATAIAAYLLPARRTMKVHPMVVLRSALA